MRIVVERGLDAVSVRTVAAEAGVSAGAVQHHFKTKDELIAATYRRAIERFAARAARLPDRETKPRAYLRALLTELLPLDPQRGGELRTAIAFSARSVHNPELAELYAEAYGALVEAVTAALTHARDRGEAQSGLDPEREAARAVALADGLAWHSLCAPERLRADDATALLDEYLNGVLAH